MSPRPPPKISLRHDWTKELGSKVDRQPEGEVARQAKGEVAWQAKFFQPTQPIHAQRAEAGQLSRSFQSNRPTVNPVRDRSGQLGITQDVIVVQDER